MKNSLFLMLLVTGIALFTFTSCDKDDDVVLTGAEVPTEIQTYVATHFPNNEILQVTQDTDDGKTTYEVTLQGNIELEFNAAKEITEIEANTELPHSVLMPELLNYVQVNYPGQVIVAWALKSAEQHIELNNDVDLVFSLNGDFLRVES